MLSELSELTIIASLIASIAGFDILSNNVFRIAHQRIHIHDKTA